MKPRKSGYSEPLLARSGGMKILLAIALLLAAMLAEARDPAEVRAFRKEHPCPATGRVYGACPNYQVDHRVPLKCGGPDRPSNMQWLTVRAHKAKTAREARWCRKARH